MQLVVGDTKMRWWQGLILILAVAIAGWAATRYIWTSESALIAIKTLEQTPVYEDINDRQQKILDILLEQDKLISSLCTLIIGGTIGILVMAAKEMPVPLAFPFWGSLGASWIALATSLYASYRHYDGLVLMLDYQFFEPFHPYFVRWSGLQFWSFFLGLAFSAFVLMQVALSLRRR